MALKITIGMKANRCTISFLAIKENRHSLDWNVRISLLEVSLFLIHENPKGSNRSRKPNQVNGLKMTPVNIKGCTLRGVRSFCGKQPKEQIWFLRGGAVASLKDFTLRKFDC